MGPLYHLTDRRDRIAALLEGRRVLRRHGVLFAVAISRYASLFDSLGFERHDDPAFAAVVERDLDDGKHRNDENVSGWFTTAFFHHPDELEAEIREAGLELESVLGIEGPGAWFSAPAEVQLWAARVTERDLTMRAVSPHLVAVARRP
jgi:hypothetical protein